MGCWRVFAEYYFGGTGTFYLCADTIDITPTGDQARPDSYYLVIDGIAQDGGYGSYLQKNRYLNIRQYAPSPEEIASGICNKCPCPPNHCSIKCDRSPGGYCCISHSFLNGLLGQLP